MASDGMIPLPANVVRAQDMGESADQPKLDELVGETVVVRALEWIGKAEPYMGVRLAVHIVKGESMTKTPSWYRAYTESVIRVARRLVGPDTSRTVKLEQWPMYKVVKSGASYALADV